MDVDTNDTLDIPIGPIPQVTHGARGRSDALLPPAKDAEVTPISTGKTLSDRFKDLHRQEQQPQQKAQVVRMVPISDSHPPQRSIPNMGPIGLKARANNQAAKLLRQRQNLHMYEMRVLQQEQRRRTLESQQLRMGNMRIIGAKPTLQDRTGIIGNINHLNRIIKNRTQAGMSKQIRTANSLNLRLGSNNGNNNNSPIRRANNGHSGFHFQNINDKGMNNGRVSRGNLRCGDRGQGSGPMQQRKSGKFPSDNQFISKNDLDNDLDQYMASKGKGNQLRVGDEQKNLDDELDQYMATAAAAKKKRNFNTTTSVTPGEVPASVNDNELVIDEQIVEPAFNGETAGGATENGPSATAEKNDDNMAAMDMDDFDWSG